MTDEFKVEKERLEQEKHQLQEQLHHVSKNIFCHVVVYSWK